MADTMLPAAPVATTTESGAEGPCRIGGRGAARSSRPMARRTAAAPADLDDAGVAERLVDKGRGHVVRSGVGFDVERP